MMDVEREIGRLVMIGFDGAEPLPQLLEMIKDYNVGGVILYKKNLKTKDQIKSLTDGIKKVSGDDKFLIAVDHEGGRVFRFPPPFTHVESMCKLGERYKMYSSTNETYETGALMARELKSVGININFAPVLDVNTNPDNPIIADRSFDLDPSIVSTLGCEIIRGMTDGGLISCGKHFPGHGDTSVDSHLGLPIINHTIERLRAIELKPFCAAIEGGVPSLMTAHIIYGAIDSSVPATISKRVLNGVLRQELGFEGVVFTDDMAMKAISDNYTAENASVMAIEAGCDVLLISGDFDLQLRTIKALRAAVREGVLSKGIVKRSADRINEMKKLIT